MHHFLMDGPSVNWNAFDLLNAEHSEYAFPFLINIGSCGLHGLHCTFKVGFQSVDWDLQKWRFFHNSSANVQISTS